jgi:hypothetical protein
VFPVAVRILIECDVNKALSDGNALESSDNIKAEQLFGLYSLVVLFD